MTSTDDNYTLSLHDALPIWTSSLRTYTNPDPQGESSHFWPLSPWGSGLDRKSTRLNSSHGYISYAVFCLKKKNEGLYQLAPEARGERSSCRPRQRPHRVHRL